MKASFLDSYRPARTQATGADSTSFRTIAGPGDSRTQSMVSTREQLRSNRFWNYIAVNRIATKLSQMTPMVSLPSRGRGRKQTWLSWEQRQHLRQHYSGVVQSVADDLTPVADNHPVVQLLKKPNGVDPWWSLVYETHTFWQLTGRAYWWIVPNALGLPAEIHCVPTDLVTPEFDREGQQIGWKVQRPGTVSPLNVPFNEIREVKFPSPLGKRDAGSPTLAGDLWIDNALALEESRGFSMRNMVRPSVLVKLDAAVYKNPDDTVLARLKEKFMSRIGSVQHTGEPLIQPPGMEVTPWGAKPSEMDFPESSDQLRDSILALRGVPRALAGMSHDLNRASIEGAEAVFCDYTISPLASMFAGFITSAVAAPFDPRIVVWFDDCKPRQAEQEREEWDLDWRLGAASPDERREFRGREAWGVEGVTDVGYIGSSLLPLDDRPDEVAPVPPGQQPNPADAEDPPADPKDAEPASEPDPADAEE